MSKLLGQKGVALITVLFFLIIITILAVGTIMISTTQVTVAGSMVRRDMTFDAAEGGVDFVIPLIQSIYYDRIIPSTYTSFIEDDQTNLRNELTTPENAYNVDTHYPLPDTDTYPVPGPLTTPQTGPDLVVWINGNQVEVDVDYMGLTGINEGSDRGPVGYYSQGRAARANMYVGYRIHSRATTPRTKSELIQTIGVPIR